MAFHNGLLIAIDLSSFQEFDRGKAIRQRIRVRYKLDPGDRFRWDVCQGVCGIAEVISRQEYDGEFDEYVIRKVS